ncbi:hypothetical protein DFH06DRAFT_1292382 [Mycena polygramma]|nr:hypothetical protein DFH06DRAFT_1292382 [Mycena polygramma]
MCEDEPTARATHPDLVIDDEEKMEPGIKVQPVRAHRPPAPAQVHFVGLYTQHRSVPAFPESWEARESETTNFGTPVPQVDPRCGMFQAITQDRKWNGRHTRLASSETDARSIWPRASPRQQIKPVRSKMTCSPIVTGQFLVHHLEKYRDGTDEDKLGGVAPGTREENRGNAQHHGSAKIGRVTGMLESRDSILVNAPKFAHGARWLRVATKWSRA